ncbi:hypothetical protein V6N13_048924 [Hibiscus sabdariffa]
MAIISGVWEVDGERKVEVRSGTVVDGCWWLLAAAVGAAGKDHGHNRHGLGSCWAPGMGLESWTYKDKM